MTEQETLLPDIAQMRLTAYQILYDQLGVYLDMPDDYRKIVALWIVGTYSHDKLPSYPYLYFNAQKGSGKSRILEFIANTAYLAGGKKQTGITESVLFRSREGATLVLDEMESVSSRDKGTLREYLNASYKKGATVERSKKVRTKEGEDYAVQTFKTYRPIVIANIYGMEDVLGDRCITLVLEKSNSPKHTKLIEDFSTNPYLQHAVQLLWRAKGDDGVDVDVPQNIVRDWNTYILGKYTPIDTSSSTPLTSYIVTSSPHQNERLLTFNLIDSLNISGRNLELILPLLVVARSMSKPLFEEILTIVKGIVHEKKEEEYAEDRDVSLIEFVSELDALRFEYIPVSQLTAKFKQFIGNSDDSEDRWLNSKWMGQALKRLKLIGDKKATKHAKMVILAVDKAKEKIKLFKSPTEKKEPSKDLNSIGFTV